MALLSEVCASIEGGATRAVPFVRGVVSSFRTRVESSPDLLADTNTLAAGAAALLPVIREEEARVLMRELLEERAETDREVRRSLVSDLKADRYALLSPNGNGSLSDFYYLPIRVTKTLGWLASSVLVRDRLSVGEDRDVEETRELAESVIECYANSIVAMSDEQAPDVYLFAEACQLWGRTDLARVVVSRLYDSLRSVEGVVTKAHVDPDEAFEYIWLRSTGRLAEAGKGIANPSQLLPCLLLCGADLALAGDMNRGMHSFDGRFINLFLSEDYADFAAQSIRSGTNHHRKIGHSVWRVEDLVHAFEEDCRLSIEATEIIEPEETKALCALASYLLPDRIPFFLKS